MNFHIPSGTSPKGWQRWSDAAPGGSYLKSAFRTSLNRTSRRTGGEVLGTELMGPAMLLLDEFIVDNGTTYLMTGSHLAERSPA